MNYQLKNFNKLCNLILEGNGFDSLSSKDFPKAYKYNNLPEGTDINITNKLSLDYLNEVNSVILSKHCIRSQTEHGIHGINYLPIPLERFKKYIQTSIYKILSNENSGNLAINSEEKYFNMRINDKVLKNDFCFIIKTVPIQHSYDINVILITIFLKKFENKTLKDILKFNDHNQKILNRNIQLVLAEEILKFKLKSFDLILFD